MSAVSFLQSTLFQMLDRVTEKLDSLSGKLGIQAMLLYIAVLIWMAFLGLAGMQLAKLFASVGMAGIGFYVGCLCVDLLAAKVSALAMFPKFTGYILGLTLAFILFSLAWRFCVPAIYLCFGLTGCFLASLFISNLWICLGAGVVLMIVGIFCFVFDYIVITSCVAAVGTVAMLGALRPNVALLQLAPHSKALWVVAGVAAVYVVIQCATTPKYRKFGI